MHIEEELLSLRKKSVQSTYKPPCQHNVLLFYSTFLHNADKVLIVRYYVLEYTFLFDGHSKLVPGKVSSLNTFF